MLTFFRRLQWKLTLSYAVVTAGTVMVLAALFVTLALVAESLTTSRTHESFYWSKTGFQDNLPFLLENPATLQTWLTRVQTQGFRATDFQSYTVRETLDYANTLIQGAPIYVLDPALNLLAAAPAPDPALLGQPFDARAQSGENLENLLGAAQTGNKNYYAQSLLRADGSYIVAFPLRRSDTEPVVAIVIYRLRPVAFATPANLGIYTTFFVGIACVMFAVALPVGAIFGWVVSRGLRHRLTRLAAAAQAWSQGDFTVAPRDKSGDEIGELTRTLNRMAEQLQTLLHTRDELARVEERNRLARDLHDTVKQQTYAARMQLTAAKNLLGTHPAAAEHLEAALQLNRETQQELKLIIDELRPAALAGKGLAQALHDYAARWQTHTGIQLSISVSGDRPLPLLVEQVLYRVLQEALANVARHAEADTVTVGLNIQPPAVTLTVADNGRGFDPQAITAHSFGLTGMRERLREINGTLTVNSTPITGTQVSAQVPL